MSRHYEHEMQRRLLWISTYSAYISSSVTAYLYPTSGGKFADEALKEFDKRFDHIPEPKSMSLGPQ